jgi:hypothetical protein
MDARFFRAVVITAVLASLGAGYRTPNFVIEASNEGLAQRVGLAAEKYRRELAVAWLGKEMPDWAEPCPIAVQVEPHLGAGGETSFVFDRGEVFGWRMRVQGNEERVLDSVLPHEITHTILATHFRRPLPRWADEGACTTVEHQSERNKQQNLLITFLRTNKGIAFSQMFAMKEYPQDILPLYAQGYSLARYLIEQGGRRKFIGFVGEGLKRESWGRAIKTYYGYENLAKLQDSWLEWVKQGSPSLENRAGDQELLVAQQSRGEGSRTAAEPASLARARFQNDDRDQVSTFDSASRWNARDSFGRGDESAVEQLAQDAHASSTAVRSNKQSVYDRGIEPSGNPQQYPFRRTAQHSVREPAAMPATASPADSSATGNLTPVAPAVAPREARGQVILEWSRDGSHLRRGKAPDVDASW